MLLEFIDAIKVRNLLEHHQKDEGKMGENMHPRPED